jgi:phosphatidylethanolamine-binding protein (PEBP) family uncharacterized protein
VCNNSAFILSEYYPPSPPGTSKPHRYQLVFYPLSKEVPAKAVPQKRGGFDLEAFKASVSIKGDYVAGTQFKAGHNME